MATLDTLKADLTEALKAGDTAKALSLRYLLAEVHNAEIAKGKDAVLTEEELAVILQKQAKQRVESIDAYQKGGREDLVANEQRELEMIRVYLPKQMGEGEIKALIEQAVSATGAASIQDMGRVMGALMPGVQGKADGALVSRLVQERLSK